MQPIEIVCHRGANEYAPENSWPSSERCIEWGIDYLEVDINTSRDGVPYLFHGPELSRTTNGKGKIYEWDSAQLDKLDCGSWFDPQFANTPIPRLESFLDQVDHRIKLFFDVKWADLTLLRDIVYSKGVSNECFFWFGRDKLAREFTRLAPGLSIKINVKTPADIIVAQQSYGAKIVEFSLDNATEEMIQTCREREVRSMILYQHHNLEDFARIVSSGADLVNLDHGDHFLNFLKTLAPTD